MSKRSQLTRRHAALVAKRLRDDLLYVEIPGAIVNICVGLQDADGRDVSRIEVLADGDRYAGNTPWWIEGETGRNGLAVRVIKQAVAPPGRAR
jgi:hypothetical protein